MTWEPAEERVWGENPLAPSEWQEIVMEGEWNVTQRKIQEQIGPEFDMYRNGTEPKPQKRNIKGIT